MPNRKLIAEIRLGYDVHYLIQAYPRVTRAGALAVDIFASRNNRESFKHTLRPSGWGRGGEDMLDRWLAQPDSLGQIVASVMRHIGEKPWWDKQRAEAAAREAARVF